MESIAFGNAHIMEDIVKQLGVPGLSVLRLSGGVARSPLLGQMIANIANTRVEQPVSLEASAISAAQFAGLYTGSYTMSNVHANLTIEKVFEPDERQEQHKKDFVAWKQAINRTLNWMN
jgi:glycerol kinase